MNINWRIYIFAFGSLASRTFSNKTANFPQKIGIFEPPDILSILYQEFSEDEKGLTHSSFEKLVNCSLGLTTCYNSTNVENPFLHEYINCLDNPKISPQMCRILHNCSSGEELLSLNHFNASEDRITKENFKSLLPAIIYQAQSQLCKRNQVEGATPSPAVYVKPKPTTIEVWGYGILFVTLISGCSLLGVSVIPLMGGKFYHNLLTGLIGLAVGSLAASALFHLVPQAFKIPAASGNHDYLFMSFFVLLGIWLFFMIERVLKIVFALQNLSSQSLSNSMSSQPIISTPTESKVNDGGFHPPESSCGGGVVGGVETNCLPHNSVSLSVESESVVEESRKPVYHGEKIDESERSLNQGEKIRESKRSLDHGEEGEESKLNQNKVNLIYASQEQAIKASFGHDQRPEVEVTHEIHFRQGKDSVIATVAWMIIFGDGFHNFIDGVSIGAAFTQSTLTGISISLAVMCEELPHELGDFAVLLNSGMTMKQALFYNFLSASTCYLGLVIGIVLGEFTQDSTYIFAIAAGMFLYIALVDMLPEMNETATRAIEKGMKESVQVLILQNVGIFIGVFSLFILAYYQDSISFD